MLPPPFNLVPTALFLVHRYHIQQREKLVANTVERSLMTTPSQKIYISSLVVPKPVSGAVSRVPFGAHASIMPTLSNGDDGEQAEEALSPEEIYFKQQNPEQQAELDRLSSVVSLCGTATDVFAGVLMAFLAPWIEMGQAVKSGLQNSYDFVTIVRDVICTVAIFICVYLPFVISLVYEALHTYTVVKIVLDEVNPLKCQAINVRYHEVGRYARVAPEHADSTAPKAPSALRKCSSKSHQVPSKLEKTIAVRVIRTFGLDDITGAAPRNPIIRIRLGRFEAVITDCARQADGAYFWSHKVLSLMF